MPIVSQSEFRANIAKLLDQVEAEGPYGEMYGFQGAAKKENFFMNIKADIAE